METSPVTCRTLETFYHINAHTFEKQYKETLSGFRGWEQLDHADTWLLFTENMGPHLAIDETSLSNGELYTFVTNRDRHAGERSLVAVVSGTKSEDVIRVLKQVDEEERMKVEEVTLDLSRLNAQDCCHRIPQSPKGSRPFPHTENGLRGRTGNPRGTPLGRIAAGQRRNGRVQAFWQAIPPVPFPKRGHTARTAHQEPLPPVQISRQMDGKTKGKGENPVRRVSRHPTRLRAVAFTEDDILQEHD